MASQPLLPGLLMARQVSSYFHSSTAVHGKERQLLDARLKDRYAV
jgi:hypothetical protein